MPMLTLTLLLVATELKPMMTILGKAVVVGDFTQSNLDKKTYKVQQGTRWSISKGILVGEASTAEYQQSKKDHKGLEPRLLILKAPQNFAAEFKLRFVGGKIARTGPFIEFGHHKARVHFATNGISLLGEKESITLSKSDTTKLELGKWYHVYAEQKGEEVVVQIDGTTTLFGKHESFAKQNESGSFGLGIAGTVGGKVEISQLAVWSVGESVQSGWDSLREKLSAPKDK
jgi:hypothetical protein